MQPNLHHITWHFDILAARFEDHFSGQNSITLTTVTSPFLPKTSQTSEWCNSKVKVQRFICTLKEKFIMIGSIRDRTLIRINMVRGIAKPKIIDKTS